MTSASPSDPIASVFTADPLELSNSDITTLILELRRRADAFAADEAAKQSAPKATRARAEPKTAAEAAASDKPITETTLDDLLG